LKTTHPDEKNQFSVITTGYLNTKTQITLHSVSCHSCRKPAGGSISSPIFSSILGLRAVALKYLKRVQWDCAHILF